MVIDPPAAADGRVFYLAYPPVYRPDMTWVVLNGVDAKTGTQLWSLNYSYPLLSLPGLPALSAGGGWVFVVTTCDDIASQTTCVDARHAAGGARKWRAPLGAPPDWAFGGSATFAAAVYAEQAASMPALYLGGWGIYALDASSGMLQWRFLPKNTTADYWSFWFGVPSVAGRTVCAAGVPFQVGTPAGKPPNATIVAVDAVTGTLSRQWILPTPAGDQSGGRAPPAAISVQRGALTVRVQTSDPTYQHIEHFTLQ